MTAATTRLSDHLNGWINAYGQVVFVNSRWLSTLLLMATFLFPYAGLSGVIAVVVGHVVADVLGFDRQAIRSGELGFNVLMTGLVLGSIYQFNEYLIFLLALAGLLGMIITLWFRKVLSDHQLPYLSLPFLVTIWILLLSVSQYKAFRVTEVGLFAYNDLAQVGGVALVEWYQRIQSVSIGPFWDVYFKSVGAIFFQYNLFAGIAIATGLLYFSRISFVFSLIGFATGYFFYQFVDGNVTDLHYSYIGFNFILTSIALGSFYLIPSFYALLVVVMVIPVTAVCISAFGSVFSIFALPIYSLPFNLVVLVMIVVLRQRWQETGPQLVWDQQFSAEKNVYTWLNRKARFNFLRFLPIHLPVVGEWRVSQGHNGAITHQGAYRYAWDFDIVDDAGKTYSGDGSRVDDFYCYGKPVVAPAAGEIVHVVDAIPDNPVGESDLVNNWGNTIIIKHSEGLYSKLSHLREGKVNVKVGDRVARGQRMAQVGSSGRSPEPHLHFQLQASPFLGSATLWYPIAMYESAVPGGANVIHHYDIPLENETVRSIKPHPLLRDAFKWEPGQTLKFTYETDGVQLGEVEWLVGVDMNNATYLYCESSKSTAWYHHSESMFQFMTFRGDTSSALYTFFLMAQRVMLADVPGVTTTDEPDVQQSYGGWWMPLQDLLAPFVRFVRISYESTNSFNQLSSRAATEAEVHVATKIHFPWKTRRHSSGTIGIGRDAIGRPSIIFIRASHREKDITLTRV